MVAILFNGVKMTDAQKNVRQERGFVTHKSPEQKGNRWEWPIVGSIVFGLLMGVRWSFTQFGHEQALRVARLSFSRFRFSRFRKARA
jgi:hypothetical protein